MSRWLAGAFDPGDRFDGSRLAAALAPDAARRLDCGPLQLAYSGPPPRSTNPLCLLDGCLDNADDISLQLGEGDAASDEELLAAGYRRWGGGLLGRMRGDFVLILWDAARGEGLIARDQLGVRPLFLHEVGGGLRFASEIRYLLALLPRRPEPDPVSLAHWIALSSRPGTETLYAGIGRLGPGEVLLLSRDGTRKERYWIPRFEEPSDLPPAELSAQVRSALERSVRRRVAANGTTGVLMSGGLDSSSVAAISASVAEGEVCACSAAFPDHPAADESELIAQLRQALELPGVSAEVRSGGLLASALEHLAAWQMPLLGWGDFWMLPLMRIAAAEGVETLLDGDGGDELFGPRSYLLADRLREGHPLQALKLARELPGGGAHVPRREVARVFGSVALTGALPYRLHEIGGRSLAKRQAPDWLRRRAAGDLIASDDPLAWRRLDGPLWWSHTAYGFARGIEEAGVFEHQRRRAALAGLEARHPLFDLDLIELALRQPPEASLDHRFSRPLLRESMAGLLPDSVRLRPGKAWFESLIIDCLSGPDGAAVRSILMGPDAELGAYVDLGEMSRALFDSDVALRENPFRWMWQVWRLLTAELWIRAQSSPVGDLALDPPPSRARVAILEPAIA